MSRKISNSLHLLSFFMFIEKVEYSVSAFFTLSYFHISTVCTYVYFTCIGLWFQVQYTYLLCLVTQLCLTICDLMICSPAGSSVHGIFQARILEQVAISYSRDIVTGVCAKVYMCMKALWQQGDGVFVHSNKYCCSGQSQS